MPIMGNVERPNQHKQSFKQVFNKSTEEAHPSYLSFKKSSRRAFIKEVLIRSTIATGGAAGCVVSGLKAEELGVRSVKDAFDFKDEQQSFLHDVEFGLLVISAVGCYALIDASIEPFAYTSPQGNTDALRALSDSILSLHPEWSKNPPSQEQMTEYMKKMYLLPPMGGKIADLSKEKPVPMEPSVTAEAHVKSLLEKRASGKLGKEGEQYIHQFTVQTRLPDDFKYVALGILASNPVLHDWDDYFYEVPWGRVGPLIHDGGVTDTLMNPYYKIGGRTDFMMRVGNIYKRNLEELERLSVKEIACLSQEELDAATKEREERDRLSWQAKAYQRLALALMAKTGDTTPQISESMVKKLVNVWDIYTAEIARIFSLNSIETTLQTPWFHTRPQELKGWEDFGRRYEADWPPIQKDLKQLEEVKENNPEICNQVLDLLAAAANSVDRIVGLK